jgi:hypothetical protein
MNEVTVSRFLRTSVQRYIMRSTITFQKTAKQVSLLKIGLRLLTASVTCLLIKSTVHTITRKRLKRTRDREFIAIVCFMKSYLNY